MSKTIRLIQLRAEIKTLQEEEKTIMQELLDSDFEKEEIEGIVVSRKTTTKVSLLPEVDKQKIRTLYPDICSSSNVLHQEKLDEKVWDYLKTIPEAVEEVISVDARKLHEVTKDYTSQSLTTFIEVRGLK